MPTDLLVTTYGYGPAGEIVQTVDPQGTINLREFDQAGRMIKQVENAGAIVVQMGVDGSPSLTEDSQICLE